MCKKVLKSTMAGDNSGSAHGARPKFEKLRTLADTIFGRTQLRNKVAELERKSDIKDTSLLEALTQLEEANRKITQMERAIAETNGALKDMRATLEEDELAKDQILRDFTTLIESSSILFSADMQIEDSLRKFTSMMTKQLEFSNCIVLIFDKQKVALTIRAQAGYVDDIMGKFEIKPGQGITGTCFETGAIQHVRNVAEHENYISGDPRTQSEVAVPIKMKNGKVVGVFDAQSMRKDGFDELDVSLLQAVAVQMGIAVENAKLYKKLQQANIELKNHFVDTTYALIQALEDRSPWTRGHSKFVANYAVMIGKEMGMNPDELKQLEYAALLHDIGKVAIEDSVLHKPGKLDSDQWEQMRRHPEIGGEIIRKMALFTHLAPAIEQHHLFWDGTQGYGKPAGLKREQIDALARIIAVADSFEAMIAKRHYREGSRSPVEAADEIIRCSGTQFDPAVVEAFKRAILPEAVGWTLPMYTVEAGGAPDDTKLREFP